MTTNPLINEIWLISNNVSKFNVEFEDAKSGIYLLDLIEKLLKKNKFHDINWLYCSIFTFDERRIYAHTIAQQALSLLKHFMPVGGAYSTVEKIVRDHKALFIDNKWSGGERDAKLSLLMQKCVKLMSFGYTLSKRNDFPKAYHHLIMAICYSVASSNLTDKTSHIKAVSGAFTMYHKALRAYLGRSTQVISRMTALTVKLPKEIISC